MVPVKKILNEVLGYYRFLREWVLSAGILGEGRGG